MPVLVPPATGPSQCINTVNTVAGCVLTGTTPDYQARVTELTGTCRTCTQSTNSQCETAFLNSAFAKGGASVKAAYCTDTHLVILSNQVGRGALLSLSVTSFSLAVSQSLALLASRTLSVPWALGWEGGVFCNMLAQYILTIHLICRHPLGHRTWTM